MTFRVFLPAADIPSFVGKGNVDLGITGHDVILEAGMSEHVTEALRLGFGKCALQVNHLSLVFQIYIGTHYI